MTKMQDEAVGLMPCPFCGGEAKATPSFEGERNDASCYICCPACDVSPDDCYRPASEWAQAVAAWNTRPEAQPSPDVAGLDVWLRAHSDDLLRAEWDEENEAVAKVRQAATALTTQAARIAALEGALDFYTDDFDGGNKARAALEPKKP